MHKAAISKALAKARAVFNSCTEMCAVNLGHIVAVDNVGRVNIVARTGNQLDALGNLALTKAEGYTRQTRQSGHQRFDVGADGSREGSARSDP